MRRKNQQEKKIKQLSGTPTPIQRSARESGRVRLLFYLLTGYIVLQFSWWAYLLIDLNRKYFASSGADVISLKTWMVVGEGSVFLVFLLTGIFIMQRTIHKEIGLVRQQRNFLLSITHELRTPLAAIKLGLQTLAKRDNLNADQRGKLQQMALENTERLHNLIDNVLLATRIESGLLPMTPERINISLLTEQLSTGVIKTLMHGSDIKTTIGPEIYANVDRGSYESIVLNLVENAAKYADVASIHVMLSQLDQLAMLTVSDMGSGIPQTEKNKIFEKFYRMGNEETRSKKGTGLGLYIVKRLAELHGATISVSDNVPVGAIFTVTFPVSR